MNKIILIGRLTKEPEIKLSNNGLTIAHYILAVDRKFKKDGEPDADFIPCTAFGKPAEFAQKYLNKGSKVAICGRIQTRQYADKTGQKRYVTEVIVDEQYFAESKRNVDNSEEQLKEIMEELKNTNENSAEEQTKIIGKEQNNKSENDIQAKIKEITEMLDDKDLPF